MQFGKPFAVHRCLEERVNLIHRTPPNVQNPIGAVSNFEFNIPFSLTLLKQNLIMKRIKSDFITDLQNFKRV
jgi:hypothetical protein